jgi:hypothetical protein
MPKKKAPTKKTVPTNGTKAPRLINAQQIRDLVTAKTKMTVSVEALAALNKLLYRLVGGAAGRAHANGQTTIRACDV